MLSILAITSACGEGTPTSLAVQAANKALQLSGIVAEDLGLVLGDCVTPVEIIPTEGQRVAGQLGIKVPAYEVSGHAAALPLFLETLGSWRKEKVPSYVLCISSNTPTAEIKNPKINNNYWLSNAAGAIIVSASNSGQLNVLYAKTYSYPISNQTIEVDKYDPITVSFESYEKFIHTSVINRLEEAKKINFDFSKSHFFFIWLPERTRDLIYKEYGISKEQINTTLPANGDSFGASLFVCLSEKVSALPRGSKIVAIAAGAGPSDGVAILERR